MQTYRVDVVIENKPGIADPEGATILNDLVLRRGGGGGDADGRPPAVSEVRTAKMLRFVVGVGDGEGPAAAEGAVRGICDEMRIYNPLVSRATFEVLRQDAAATATTTT